MTHKTLLTVAAIGAGLYLLSRGGFGAGGGAAGVAPGYGGRVTYLPPSGSPAYGAGYGAVDAAGNLIGSLLQSGTPAYSNAAYASPMYNFPSAAASPAAFTNNYSPAYSPGPTSPANTALSA